MATPPYKKFVIVGDDIAVGPLVRNRRDDYSHDQLFIRTAGRDWAAEFDRTACGWFIGDGRSVVVSLAYYTVGGLPRPQALSMIRRWARSTGTSVVFAPDEKPGGDSHESDDTQP